MNICEKCGGSGYLVDDSGVRKECACRIRERAIEYLTPKLAGVKYISEMNHDFVKGKDLLIHGAELVQFKSFVKSYLLNTLMKKSWEMVTAVDVMEAQLSDEGKDQISQFRKVDLLCLILCTDPPNRTYHQVLESLISQRRLNGLNTWVYSKYPVSSERFERVYQRELTEFFKRDFIIMNKIGGI